MASRFAGAHELSVVMTLKGHRPVTYHDDPGDNHFYSNILSIFYFPDGQQMISASGDKTTRLWDLQAGKEIEEARVVCEKGVGAVVVSRDGRWVVTNEYSDRGELKAREVKKGIVKTFEGYSGWITCIDISMDSKLLASGSGCTTRIWSLDTGKLVAGPLETQAPSESFGLQDRINAVRFSQDSKKVAMSSDYGIEVWDIEAQKLEARVQNQAFVYPYKSPVLCQWTKDRTIVASINFSDKPARTVYEFDSSLETVRAPFEGHKNRIRSLALSFDSALLVSASINEIKLWAFESRQLLASFDVQLQLHNLILSPNARQVAYTTFNLKPSPPNIYICDIPPDILANIWPGQETIARKNPHTSDPLDSDATTHRAAVHPIPPTASITARQLRHSPPIHQQQSFILRHLSKLLPSSLLRDAVPPVSNEEPCDPLDFPATSARLPSHSSAAPAITLVHSNLDETSRATPALPISQSSTSASTSITSRLRQISSWWSPHTGNSLPPIINVPLAQGQERNAAAGAPRGDDGYRCDEEFDSRPSSPNSESQRTSAPPQIVTGEHGSCHLCSCF